MKDVEVIKARNTLSPRARTNFEKRLRVAAYCRVSTDTEDQLNSYKSQVKYYTELIKSKPEWSLAGIYADEPSGCKAQSGSCPQPAQGGRSRSGWS